MRRALLAICMIMTVVFAFTQIALADGALYPFYDGEDYRLMDTDGDMAEDLKCDYLTQMTTNDGTVRFIAYMSDSSGSHAELLDEEGEILTDGDYDAIYYENGAFLTISGDLYGIIDSDGDEILPVQYTSIVPTGEGTYFTSTDDPYDSIADELYLTSSDGESRYICSSQGFMGNFSEGLLCAASRDGLYGYMNSSGQWSIAPTYDTASDFCGGIAVVMRGSSYGLIDMSGNVILPIRYDAISAWVSSANGSLGGDLSMIIAMSGDSATIYDRATMLPLKTIGDIKYAYMPTSGIAVLGSDSATYVYSYSSNSIVLTIDPTYALEVLSDERALVVDYDGGNVCIYDLTGAGADVSFSDVTGAYGMYDDSGACTVCICREDGGHTLWGVFSLDGTEILPIEYDTITRSCADVFSVKQGSLSGLIRSDGQWIFRMGE